MTKATLKKNLHKTIDIVNNESILNAVYTILSNSINLEVREPLPFTLEEYVNRQRKSLKQIKEGMIKSHSSIKKKYSK
jgi:hypothetical protein